MAIVHIASEFGNDDRFYRHELRQTRIRFAHFELETFGSVRRQRRRWSVSAERDPVAITLAGEIIFERVPFSFWLIKPVHMPDPGQIVRAFRAHKIDDVPVSRDVTLRTFARAAIPFVVPTKPIPVRFGSPL